METDALDYHLPPELIATAPAEPRDAARLMVCDRATGRVSHHRVRDLPALGEAVGLPRAGDLLLVNHSKVVPARFFATRIETGGKVEGLFLAEPEPMIWRVMFETRGRLRAGERVALKPGGPETPIDDTAVAAVLTLIEPLDGGVWRCELDPGGVGSDTWGVLDAVGSTPLPPYIRKARRTAGVDDESDDDRERYNTVYAEAPGSVAAPTAGLHFTPRLLGELDAMGVRRMAVTLHVGPGTLAPVRSKRLEEHAMHAEWIEVPDDVVRAIHEAREAGGRVLAVGTTTVRAIESVSAESAAAGRGYLGPTSLFITPESGHAFRHTDALMTNFHLPRSTLLAMVAALPGVGLERLMQWYREAIDAGYRFYSYGDAMVVV